MIPGLRLLWQSHKGLVLAFALAAGVTVFFLTRSVLFAIYWADPAHRFQPIEAWMTPRYIGYSYDLPAEDVAAMLGLTGTPAFRPTLARIAGERGVPVADLIETLRRNLPPSPVKP